MYLGLSQAYREKERVLLPSDTFETYIFVKCGVNNIVICE